MSDQNNKRISESVQVLCSSFFNVDFEQVFCLWIELMLLILKMFPSAVRQLKLTQVTHLKIAETNFDSISQRNLDDPFAF